MVRRKMMLMMDRGGGSQRRRPSYRKAEDPEAVLILIE